MRRLVFICLAFAAALFAVNAHAFEPITFGQEGAFLKFDYQGQLYLQWRDTGSGPDGTKDTSDIYFRRNRLTFWAHGPGNYGGIVQLEYVGARNIDDLTVSDQPETSFSVLDAYFMYEPANEFRIYAGKQKIQFTRENLEDCFVPLTLDRSLFIYTLDHSRDTGVVFWGNVPDVKGQYRFEISKGNDGGANTPKSTFMFTGRAAVSLLTPEYAYGYKGTYLGKEKVLTIGAGAQYQPDAVFSDITAKTGAKNYKAWTADIFFEYPFPKAGAVTLSTAYLQEEFGGAYKGANPDPVAVGIDGEKHGWYAKAAYLLPGKVGPGLVQPFVRYEDWNFAEINGVYAQKIKWTGAGVNYLIHGESLRVTLQYSRTDFQKELNPDSRSFNTLTAMLQYRF